MKGYAMLIGSITGLVIARHWIGGLIGGLIGWLIDSGFFRLAATGVVRGRDPHAPMAALFALLGRLAKIDGRVDETEIAVCEQLIRRLGLDSDGRRIAVESFQNGKQLDFDLTMAYAELRTGRQHAPLFLDVFIDMALADGRIDPEERRLLGKFAWMLGVRESALELLLRRRGGPRRTGSAGGASTAARSDPYAVLGVERTASDADVRHTFRKLVSQHHPDKLVAKGSPPEMVKLAQQRTQEILAAYEDIKTARGMKS